MTSYLNSLTSHYTSLKRLLPNSLSADSDLHITDPEDSHVSRVLRAYYTEKGRPFPSWLGPDPNAPAKAVVAAFATQPNMYGQAGARPGAGSMRNGHAAGGLDDLFGAPSNSTPPPREEPLSLRSRRRVQPAPQVEEQQPQARPLPSQRFGSYQQRGSPAAEDPYSQPAPPMATREQSAKDRLKARLGGSRSASPNPAQQGGPSYAPPQQSSRGAAGVSAPNPYDRGGIGGGGGGGGGGYNPYESGNGGGNPYASSSSRGGGSDPYASGGNSRRGASSQPYTSATAPWSSGDDGYGGGNDYSGGSSRRGQGLPSNPRRQR